MIEQLPYVSQIDVRPIEGGSNLWEHGRHIGVYWRQYCEPQEWIEISTGLSSNKGHYQYVLLHELAHSTGIGPRLARPGLYQSNESVLSQEELIADLAATSLMEELDIRSDQELKDVILHRFHKRCSELQWDDKLIKEATRSAYKAVKYILR